MSLTGHKFQVSLSIKRDDGNALVFYKPDGQRFENDITIKMKVQTPYKLLLTVRPPQKIKLASMKGEELEMTSEEVNSESTKYAFEWNSNNIPVTKKNRRLSFNLILEIQNGGVLELPLQMKFYNASDTHHSAWGKSLNHIEFNCMHKTGSSFVEIISTVYR
ncbi:CB1 cannabinoid receptor-interacting protein 1-like [Argiope bruennichi]|uniref:CB1 cannabinoid receptor-interacting protein 1-like n=1 Tax=Argiope bruennichi TaxID=94029 RepID=UPI002494630F|nr:CB1 cannabinoid receptor-interacting protein 1-like [Argiope bruennichi]